MTMAAVLLLSQLSTSELRRADRIAGDILNDVLLVKAGAEDPRIAKLRDMYVKALRKVMESKLKRFESVGFRGTVADMMAFADVEFGPDFTKKMAPAVMENLWSAFQLGQRMKVVPDNIATLWDKPRKEAVDWLVEHDRFWLGRVFPEHLSDDFRNTIVAGMEEGLGRKDIGARLREMVLGKPGMPAKQEYYNRIAAASVNRARNWGGMFSLNAAGFTEYEIHAVMDERTSAICREMDEKVFRVRDAMDLINRTLAAEPADIETLAPWPRYDVERNDHFLMIGGEKEYLSGKSSSWLAGQGLSLPPYHGNCLRKGTRVFTEQGPLPIEQIEVDAKVLTGRGRFRRVYATPTAATAEFYRIRTEAGRELVVTGEHPVWTKRGWVSARDIRPGDVVRAIGDGVRCAICGHLAPSSLQKHIRRDHGLLAAEYSEQYDAPVVCKQLSVIKSCAARRQMLGWAAGATPEERKQRTAKANEAARNNPEHGRWLRGRKPWNYGLTKDDGSLVAASSERMIENNPMADPEIRARAARSRKGKLAGRRNPMYGRRSPFSKTVKYIYKGIRMRSPWEIKAAEFMGSIGIGWDYEPVRFVLGDRTYAPDFRLETGQYVEVKGWFHKRHRETVRRFREMHPHLELIVIQRLEDLECLTELKPSSASR